ncbi:hypothetical protein EK21DRAFT_113837 [Setomelanomma holmii]|uniref:Protein kinase domain-containing protein n=1 Tax=Setomelanomma holmii TaxID=210430 RepID=A0A9P4LM01_9PLEO|nr:hypothetical protein EK21DRAFT_113837 [Setomelanomma holmii]
MTGAGYLPEFVRDFKLEATIHENVTIHTRSLARRGTLQREVWERTNILRHGGSGEVWQERKIEGPGSVEVRAVKRIRNGSELSAGRNEGRRVVRELEALAKFSQEKYTAFFVKFYGWYVDKEWLYIAME